MRFGTTLRRIVATTAVATVFSTVGAAVVALPTGTGVAQAAPRETDPLAELATNALAMANRATVIGDQTVWAAYDALRDDLAARIAERLELPVHEMQRAWRAADIDHQRALMGAMSQLGVPYRRNTSKPGVGFDCSGITTYAWAQAGFELTRQSGAQIREAAPRDEFTAQAADLMQYPGHVMMWLGVGRAVIHSPYSGRTVEVDILGDRKVRFGDPTE
jgi:NlpC/P60 family